MDLTSFGGSQVQFDPLGADGSMTVAYDYTIPEPASIAMIGLIGGACLMIRRTFLI